ncbi:MAG: universal stress protein [Planctomycetaceae bacterium]|nr:universal stress protein [Planctomycetaceae bacterium]
MQHFRNLLVGVDVSSGERLASFDLSPATFEAIKRGVWLARELGAEVTFQATLDLSAETEEILHEGFGDASRSVEQAASDVLEKLCADAKDQGVTARSVVAFGLPWEALTKQVLNGKHDLLLVGTRNRGATSRMLFGSTSLKLLRVCPCPVWVTRPDPKFDDINMLVACGLGPESDRLLHTAVGGGRLLDARVHLIHAVELGEFVGDSLIGQSREALEEHRAVARKNAEHALRESLSHTDFRTLRHGVQIHLEEGEPETVLLEAIPKYGIDLLVMGTKVRTGLSGVFFGNTAERLLSKVDCSVFVVKPEGFVSPVTVD